MERRLLDALGFQCTVPTSRVFVRRFVQAAAPDFRDSRCGAPACSSHSGLLARTSASHARVWVCTHKGERSSLGLQAQHSEAAVVAAAGRRAGQ